ncbi:MAG: O-antigen ligase family protein [Labilibaculum sp.]|nr:O-antigen ligase family protein [Labilibaculum sp.]
MTTIKKDISILANKNSRSIGILLFIMIASYFSPSESASFTQLFKIGSRLIALVWCFLLYHSNCRKGMIASFVYKNNMALWLYIAYLLLAFASFLWITEGPERSAKVAYSVLQWNMTLQSFLFVYFFAKLYLQHNYFFSDYPVNLIRLLAEVITLIALILLIGSLIAPDIFYRSMRGGSEIRLGGYLMNPNELGMLNSMGAGLALLLLFKENKKWKAGVMFAISLLSLALTSSRSSVIAFLLIAMLILQKKAGLQLKIVAFGLIGVAIPFILQYVIFKAGNVEEVLSMTGRIPFWTALLDEGIVKEPFLGYGFHRIAYTNRFESLTAYPGHMTHNTFLQVLMNLGFIGFLITLFQIIFLVRGVIKSKDKEKKEIFLAMSIPLFINSITEFGIFGQTNYSIFFYQFLIFLVVLKYNPAFNPQEKIAVKIFYQNLNHKTSAPKPTTH